jgi:molecular chaperone DnaK
MAKLNTRNLQAGIDLGTTNSEIAIFQPEGIKVLDVGGGEILLPSCVYVDDSKSFYVGQEALNKMNADPVINGHIEFKRKMGTDYAYSFNNINNNLRPEELSGLVLNKLKAVYKDHVGEDLYSAVITVPAKFDLRPCQATRIAAMGNYSDIHLLDKDLKDISQSQYYASFLHAEILMEPIAASLCYGLNNGNAKNGNWLVYDLGGGTFDAAIVNNFNGGLNVKHHAGDNFLGGKNMDQALLEYIVNEILMKEHKYDLDGFFSLAKYTAPRAYLKWAVENAKKTLSTEREVLINIPKPDFKDNKGKDVKASVPVTRAKYISLVGPIYLKSIEIAEKLLSSNKLNSKDIDRIILVGGPTKFPWLKEQLETILKIGVDNSVDPMIAIAKGAAIQATLSNPPVTKHDEIININTKKPVDCILSINSERTTTETEYVISGRIVTKMDNSNDIQAITFERGDNMWTSGKFNVAEDGTFSGELLLNESALNSFNIKIVGKNGVSFSLTPNEFQILHTRISVNDIAPYSLNVTIKDGFCIPVVKKDAVLPVEETEPFHTLRDILKDNDEDIITIELTEGESVYAENNTKIGELKVPGQSLSRNLPVNSELFITIKETSDRNIFASCYIPFTKQTFEATINIMQSKPSKDETLGRVKNLENKFKSLSENKELLIKGNLNNSLDDLKFNEKLEGLNGLLAKDKDEDIDNLLKANQQVSENLHELEQLENKVIFVKLWDQLNKIKNDKKIYNEFKDEIDDLEVRLGEAEGANNYRTAKAIEDELSQYDISKIALEFVILLYCFSFTKLYDFQKFLIEVKQMFIKEVFTKTLSFNIPYEIQKTIDVFSNGIADINTKINSGKLASTKSIINQLDYNIRQVYNNQLNKTDTYPDDDYEDIILIINSLGLTDTSAFITRILKLKPSGDLMKAGKRCAEAIEGKNISEAKLRLKEFRDLYYINKDIIGKLPGAALGVVIGHD